MMLASMRTMVWKGLRGKQLGSCSPGVELLKRALGVKGDCGARLALADVQVDRCKLWVAYCYCEQAGLKSRSVRWLL